MNPLIKILTGLLAATAAASSMAQSTSTNVNCNSFIFDAAFTNCQIFVVSKQDDTTLLDLVPDTWGVTRSIHKDSLSILNEASEKVVSLTTITPNIAGQKPSYELTFKQAVTGPFALILGPVAAFERAEFPAFYRFGSGVSAGDTFSIKLQQGGRSGLIGLSYAAVVGATTPVPEPETYVLALAGLSVAVWAVRRPKA